MSSVEVTQKTSGTSRRLLLIGWDAADWDVIHPLLEKGEMPALASLMKRGCHGTLETLYPPLSPMLWTSIATGKRPYKHGIHGFSEPNPNGPGIRPVSNLSRKTKAVWNILQHQKLKSNVIGWWPSHPVEPIDGVMVSNQFHSSSATKKGDIWPMSPGTVHPPRLHEHLIKLRFHPEEISPADVLPFIPRAAEIDQEKDRRLAGLCKILAECVSINAAATAVMQNEPWDFMGVYFDAIDHFSHLFMKYHPPRQDSVSEEDFEMYQDVVSGGYRFHDMMLASILELADENTNIMLISDHGFHPGKLRPTEIPTEPAGPAAEHSPYGIFVAAGPDFASNPDEPSLNGASLLDITPTILHHFGLPIGDDMDGRVLEEIFREKEGVKAIPSWDFVEGECGLHRGDYTLDPDASHAALEQMVALGYIEDPGEKVETMVSETRRELRYNLARSYMSGHRHIDAIPILRECWDEWPDESRFGVQLLQCHLSLQQVVEARAVLNQLVERKGKAVENAAKELEELSRKYEKEKKPPESLTATEGRQFRKLRLRASVNHFAAKMLEGQVAYAEKNFETALADFQNAFQANQQRPEVRILIGKCLHRLDRSEEAVKSFKEALAIDPLDAGAHLELCRAYLGLGKTLEAEQSARQSIATHFQNPWAHYSLGLSLNRQKKHADAVAAFSEAVTLNPNFPQAYTALSKLYKGPLRQPELAFQMLGRESEARKNVEAVKAGVFQPMEEMISPRAAQIQVDYQPSTEVIASIPEIDPESAESGEIITVVTGLPRSGTSLMMSMLEAAGIPVLTDGLRSADDDNPRGYFEYTPATELRRNRSWVPEARGKVVKVVAHLLPFLPREERYRFIFLERSLDEILASQSKMLERQAKQNQDSVDLRSAFAQQITKSMKHLEMRKQPVLRVPFSHAVKEPLEVAHQLLEFLGSKVSAEKVAARIDASLYRNKSTED